ncbi:MAG: response regulator [Elusimicrobiota bacterium]
MTILLADDDATIRRISSLILTRKGEHVVICAADGAEAIALAERERPDVILLDGMMPGLDGYQACRKLRSQKSTRDIPIIFLSANAGQAAAERALNLGATGTIFKPFDPRTLPKRIQKILDEAPSYRALGPKTA